MALTENLGKKVSLKIVKQVDFGVYLGNSQEKVLLPKKQLPEQAQVGDTVEVFIYRDSKDRLIATTGRPGVTLHRVARLRVAQVGKIGAFLDWGLEKDLLLPFKEQTRKVTAGEECLAALYIDKSSRLCATMNVYPYLDTDSPYRKDDRVRGTVYEISRNFGAFVAVDDKYSGLIPQRELYGPVQIGDVVQCRVPAVACHILPLIPHRTRIQSEAETLAVQFHRQGALLRFRFYGEALVLEFRVSSWKYLFFSSAFILILLAF